MSKTEINSLAHETTCRVLFSFTPSVYFHSTIDYFTKPIFVIRIARAIFFKILRFTGYNAPIV